MRETFYTLIFLLCLSINCQAMSPAMLGGAGGGAVAAGCSVGTTDALTASFNTMGSNNLIGALYTAACTGKLSSAAFHTHASTNASKVCVYLDDGDNAPDTGDSLIECTGAITPIVDNWATGNFAGTADITATSKYWIMFVGSDVQYVHGAASGTTYIKAIADSYTSPPATLEAGFGTTTKTLSIYVTVE